MSSNTSNRFAAQSKVSPPVSQGVGSGQSTTSTSEAWANRTLMNAGRGQQARSSNTEAQDQSQPSPGFGRGNGQWPSPRAIGRGRGAPSVSRKRVVESLAEVCGESAAERPLKASRLSHQHEASTQTDILDEPNSLKPPADDSDDTTSIMIQRNSSRGVEIDLKINPDTEEGRELLLDAARRVWQQNGNVDILVSMRPVMGAEEREKH